MNNLRLALLAIGILILVVIYFYSRWEAQRKEIRDQELERRRMQTLDAYDEDLEALAGSATVHLEPEILPKESVPSPTSQTGGEIQGLRGQEEEFFEDPNDVSTLLEEAKKHYPKKESEHIEAMSTKEYKKSRFALPKKWLKAKPKPEPTSRFSSPQSEEYLAPELIVALTVVARGKGMFRGKDIVQILEDKGLQYGEMDIYHAYSPGGRPIFSVANIIEPGSFDIEMIDRFTTPGLALFLRLPGPAGGFAAFDAMLEVAQLLAGKLSGEIRDERRNVLTTQAIQQMRERILTFNRARRSLGV
jgi:cell division protein ZipA